MAAILKTFLAVAICIAYCHCFEVTIGDYELEERHIEMRSLEARKDMNEFPWTKTTVAFETWESKSQLFRQCSNDDYTLNVQFAYLTGIPGALSKVLTKYVPTTTQVKTEPTYTSISSDSFWDCAKKVVSNGNYTQFISWTDCGFLCFSSYTVCKAAKTSYNATDGHKCSDDRTAGVFVIE